MSIADEIVVIAEGCVRSQGVKSKVLPTLLSDEKAGRCPLGKGEAMV